MERSLLINMVSKKLKSITFVALGVIYLHGVEEILMGFYQNDSTMKLFGHYFNLSANEFYWISHLIWWITLPILFLLVVKKQLFWLMVLFGIVFIVEIHHLIKAAQAMTYYPGMLTAIFYPIIGFFYWRELIINLRKNYGRS